MGINHPSKRDGTGPAKRSWQRKNVGVGRRRKAGVKCPVKKK